ncbi:diacylglycerol/lipid kinase family protein [Roseisolibacter agri]|uniref:Lipid kinase YegS-like protein n=1 Tax=Roseisolibacter agri TaxID=2014610 RepID=A0AA37QGP7_9BACT|nr:YegS/Rv2252/BmrU family lipid kinase [Roseisolibacter agri]GLC26478.1 putative lipid kinase YegS-like protein [Roseisolibacter agri]
MTFGRTFDLVIHGARADDAGLRAAAEWARTIGHRIRAHVTWEPGDARRFAAEAARRGTDAVLAVGGDGTVNEVVNGLLGTDVPLGILPVGTANDFARQTGIPEDARAALDLVIERPPVVVDLGTLNDRAFLNVSSAGLGAETTAETGAVAKGMLGPLAYALTGVRKLAGEIEPRRARFSGPSFEREVEFLLFAVGNARATGAGTVITPLARVDDGMLDVCLVEPMALGAFAGLLLELRRGDHLERDGVLYAQLPWVRVESEVPLTVNLDGEPQSLTQLEYRVLPRALRVHVGHLPGEGGENGAG